MIMVDVKGTVSRLSSSFFLLLSPITYYLLTQSEVRCQLTITWTFQRMSTINLNTACICLLASNARSLQENSQSERTYYGQTFAPTTLNILLFRDRRSVTQQCWICLRSSSNIVGASHAHYTWSPKS